MFVFSTSNSLAFDPYRWSSQHTSLTSNDFLNSLTLLDEDPQPHLQVSFLHTVLIFILNVGVFFMFIFVAFVIIVVVVVVVANVFCFSCCCKSFFSCCCCCWRFKFFVVIIVAVVANIVFFVDTRVFVTTVDVVDFAVAFWCFFVFVVV